jgi:3'-phosphoadenosine 5'-phosphosulfate sulfotransferase (PAPS reductase)/FAD synthetase
MDALNRGVSPESVSYVGITLDEADRTLKNIADKKRMIKKYPLIEWGITEADALEYCYAQGFTWGGLYKHFRRVSCYCCPLQRIGELRKLRKYYPEQWAQMLEWDSQIQNNRGFRGYDTVADLEAYFAYEDAQTEFCFAEVEA